MKLINTLPLLLLLLVSAQAHASIITNGSLTGPAMVHVVQTGWSSLSDDADTIEPDFLRANIGFYV